MEKKDNPNLFKKGTVNNPNGGRAHDPVLKTIRVMSNRRAAEICSLVMLSTKKELDEILMDPTTLMSEVNLISAIFQETQKGKSDTLRWLMDRVLGKPKEYIEFSDDPNNKNQLVIEYVSIKKETKDEITDTEMGGTAQGTEKKV